MEKQKCLKCGRAMPSIGRNRANGKDFLSGANYNKDWKRRKYHKKCWKEHQEDIEWEYKLKQLQLERLEKENQEYRNLCLSLDIENPPPSLNSYDKYQLLSETETEEEEEKKEVNKVLVSFD